MKSFFLSFVLVFVFLSPSLAESINIKLISYEDDTSYDDTAICELEFTVTNNSWGTMYGLSVETESYDDRGDKLDDYAFSGNINAFGGMFSDIDRILVGNSATSKSLQLKSRCKYIGKIYLKKVKPGNCNVRMMPENGNCLAIINPSSDIDHIKLIRQ